MGETVSWKPETERSVQPFSATKLYVAHIASLDNTDAVSSVAANVQHERVGTASASWLILPSHICDNLLTVQVLKCLKILASPKR